MHRDQMAASTQVHLKYFTWQTMSASFVNSYDDLIICKSVRACILPPGCKIKLSLVLFPASVFVREADTQFENGNQSSSTVPKLHRKHGNCTTPIISRVHALTLSVSIILLPWLPLPRRWTQEPPESADGHCVRNIINMLVTPYGIIPRWKHFPAIAELNLSLLTGQLDLQKCQIPPNPAFLSLFKFPPYPGFHLCFHWNCSLSDLLAPSCCRNHMYRAEQLYTLQYYWWQWGHQCSHERLKWPSALLVAC